MEQATFDKARLYQMDKSNFGKYSGLYAHVEMTLILIYGGMPYVWNYSGQLLAQYGFGPEYEVGFNTE